MKVSKKTAIIGSVSVLTLIGVSIGIYFAVRKTESKNEDIKSTLESNTDSVPVLGQESNSMSSPRPLPILENHVDPSKPEEMAIDAVEPFWKFKNVDITSVPGFLQIYANKTLDEIEGLIDTKFKVCTNITII